MSKSHQPNHSKEELAGLSAMFKRISAHQNFATIGDELGSHDSAMVMAGIRAAGKPLPHQPPATASQGPGAPGKRKVKVVRDEDGAITGFETE